MLVALVVLAGCGGSDSNSDSSSKPSSKPSSGSSDGSAALGTEQKATGAPVKIGFVGDGKSDAIDNTSELEAAKAAVEYANTYLNGINGHVIELTTCETKQTPSGATDCGTKMVDAKVVAVLNGVSGQAGSIFKGLEGSGIPFFGYAEIDQDILLKPGAFSVTNGIAAIAGPALVAKAKGLTKAAVIVSDVPAATGPIKAVGPIFYKNAGVDLNVVPVSPSVADPTPQIQSAISAGAQQFAVVGNPTLCTASLKALKTLGFKGPVVVIPQCLEEGAGATIPGGYEGVTLLTSTTDDASDPDVKLYDAVMTKYAKGVRTGGVAPGGYIAVIALQRALEGMTGDLTAASVTAALSTMSKPADVPLGGGVTFQCGTKPVAITPNICAAKSLAGTLDKDGRGHDFSIQDTSSITKLG
jgi:branched-chain amino acid transport system substrate-binding protein